EAFDLVFPVGRERIARLLEVDLRTLFELLPGQLLPDKVRQDGRVDASDRDPIDHRWRKSVFRFEQLLDRSRLIGPLDGSARKDESLFEIARHDDLPEDGVDVETEKRFSRILLKRPRLRQSEKAGILVGGAAMDEKEPKTAHETRVRKAF